MNGQSIGSALLLAAAALPVSSVAAHHSTAFYSPDTIELEGELVRLDWVNPHVRMRAQDHRPGRRREALAHGVELDLDARAARRHARAVQRRRPSEGSRPRIDARRTGFQLTNMLLPDGREASLWLDSPPRFGDAAMIRRSDSVVDAARENRGIFRVWSVPRVNSVTTDEVTNQPFTPAAVAARASFDMNDNFATRCGPEGMPRVMWSPLPWEIRRSRRNDRAARRDLRHRAHDPHDERCPRRRPRAARSSATPSGRWERWRARRHDDARQLAVLRQHRHAAERDVRIVERFTLSADQTRLDFHVTVTDPATLTAPAIVDGHWLALGAELPRFDCQAER